ncbi:hypothetical protein TNCV_1594321 [Trichonephila clavipes]|nr:hypothetical protein TNCV_1594321 [Trichonephila clavipes]
MSRFGGLSEERPSVFKTRRLASIIPSYKSHRTCVGCFGETYCSTLTSSREHLTTQTDAGSGMSIPTARNVAQAGSEYA